MVLVGVAVEAAVVLRLTTATAHFSSGGSRKNALGDWSSRRDFTVATFSPFFLNTCQHPLGTLLGKKLLLIWSVKFVLKDLVQACVAHSCGDVNSSKQSTLFNRLLLRLLSGPTILFLFGVDSSCFQRRLPKTFLMLLLSFALLLGMMSLRRKH
jgi:hypothetical protein